MSLSGPLWNGSSDAILPNSFTSVMNKLFSVSSPRLAHVVQRHAALPAGQGAPQAGVVRRRAWVVSAQILGGRRWPVVPARIGCPLCSPLPLVVHSPSQRRWISKQPNLHPFMNLWRQHASVLLCSRLQDCVGGISFYFATLPFFFPSIFLKQENGASHRGS